MPRTDDRWPRAPSSISAAAGDGRDDVTQFIASFPPLSRFLHSASAVVFYTTLLLKGRPSEGFNIGDGYAMIVKHQLTMGEGNYFNH